MVAVTQRIPIFATLVIFVAVVTMFKLGMWQIDRMQEKQKRLTALEMKSREGNVGLSDLPESLEEARDYPVEFSGVPDSGRIMMLDNRMVNGTVGYEVLVPVETNVGSVLVNYGWVKAGKYRGELPKVDISSSLQVFKGNVVIPSLNPMVTETNQANSRYPMLLQQIDLPRLNEMTNLSLQPFVISIKPTDQAFKRNWIPVVMAPEKHLAYAIQWFGLAVAAIAIYFFAVLKRKNS